MNTLNFDEIVASFDQEYIENIIDVLLVSFDFETIIKDSFRLKKNIQFIFDPVFRGLKIKENFEESLDSAIRQILVSKLYDFEITINPLEENEYGVTIKYTLK